MSVSGFRFISSPVVVLISSLAVPKWMRENIVNGVELFIAFEAHLVFYLLTQPNKANKNFPFHVRTTQIGVMDQEKETGDGTLDRFSSYPYAPTNNVRINSISNGQQQALSSQTSLPDSHPVENGLDTVHVKRHQANISLAAASVFAFPPGFIVDANNLSDTELNLNNRRNKQAIGWIPGSSNDYQTQASINNQGSLQEHEMMPIHVNLKEIKPDKDI